MRGIVFCKMVKMWRCTHTVFVMFQTILGHGVDCHLLGIRELAAELGLPTPDIFTDPTYIKSNHFTLSTSQVIKLLFI